MEGRGGMLIDGARLSSPDERGLLMKVFTTLEIEIEILSWGEMASLAKTPARNSLGLLTCVSSIQH